MRNRFGGLYRTFPQRLRVHATARFKPQGDRADWPDAVPPGAEPGRWGYVETEPIPVCTLHDGTEIEAGLWSTGATPSTTPTPDSADTATPPPRLKSLLNRLYDLRRPDPSDEDVADAVRPFLENAQAAAELDRQIRFTDGLIDQIVYRLYGLTDEEVAVVEGCT